MEEKQIVLFSLSTCPVCKKTKMFLDKKKVEYVLVELDLVDLDSRDKLLAEVRKFNPRETFPTLVISSDRSLQSQGKGEKVIVGYNEPELISEFGGQ
ncbi:MAG: glutaredoxin family protein [Nitrospirae bacterium]|nr:glutaredoxin family protein [Nitrospirota bacterium]MBF0591254.1 glutaredoxin family protein [Nitrospirota bacterium]